MPIAQVTGGQVGNGTGPRRWRVAMAEALYGSDGFYRSGTRPAAHFRTSALTGTVFARGLARLCCLLDQIMDHPDPLDLVDIGAGGGELLTGVGAAVPADLAGRLRLTAVELAGRPDHLPAQIRWQAEPPAGVIGLVMATEWLDNIPLDVVRRDDRGVLRYQLVDTHGRQSDGPAVQTADLNWLRRWWSLPELPDVRAQPGGPRDDAWATAIMAIHRGAALCVDYGHTSAARPAYPSIDGYRSGRAVPAVPDGRSDLTAPVAFDSLAAVGEQLTAGPALVRSQRDALRALGVHGRRPPLEQAARDPAGYLRALADASVAAELTDPNGLGGHLWLLQPVGLPAQALRFLA